MATNLIPLSSKPTMWGGYLNSCLMHGLPFDPLPNTTFNEKFQIHHQTAVPSGLVPKIQYFAVGNRGGAHTLTGDGLPITKEVPHGVVDAGLYGHTPFVLRTLNNDLSDVERQKYGMRVPKTYNNVTYWAYYLRRFNNGDNIPAPSIKKIVVTDPDIDPVITDYTPTSANLTPTPPVIPNNGAITSNGTYYSVSVPLSLTMDTNDIDEYLNVAEIIHGDRAAALITELAIVAGYRGSVPLLNAQGAPATGTYMEALRATPTNYIAMNASLATINGEFTLNLDSGITEPEYGIVTV